jgi:hypothetical protein
MDALIAERLSGRAIPASIGAAWRRLECADGRIPIGSLVSQAGCSHRTLIAGLERCVGLPPKSVARLLRFNCVLRSLDRLSRTRAHEPVGKPYLEITQVDGPRVPRDCVGRPGGRWRVCRSGASRQRVPSVRWQRAVGIPPPGVVAGLSEPAIKNSQYGCAWTRYRSGVTGARPHAVPTHQPGRDRR